jgi:hypothetical protein
MNKKLFNLLYKSFDGTLTAKEKEMLNKGLSESAALRNQKEKIELIRERLAASKKDSFKPFFAERVMNNIQTNRKRQEQQKTGFDSLVALFRPIAFATTMILIILLSYNMKKTQNYTLAGALGQEQVTLEQVMDPTYMFTME